MTASASSTSRLFTALSRPSRVYSGPFHPATTYENTPPAPSPNMAMEIARKANLLEQPLNDYGNGQRLIVAHGRCLRYCPAFKTWLVYTGSHWLVDRVDAARRLAQPATVQK